MISNLTEEREMTPFFLLVNLLITFSSLELEIMDSLHFYIVPCNINVCKKNSTASQVTGLIKYGPIHISPTILAFTGYHRIKYKGGRVVTWTVWRYKKGKTKTSCCLWPKKPEEGRVTDTVTFSGFPLLSAADQIPRWRFGNELGWFCSCFF